MMNVLTNFVRMVKTLIRNLSHSRVYEVHIPKLAIKGYNRSVYCKKLLNEHVSALFGNEAWNLAKISN